MKNKTQKIIIILLITLLFSGCSKKTAMTPNFFSAYFEDLGYKILDLSEQYKEHDITTALIAKKNNYQIEFFEYLTQKEANNIVEANAKKIISLNLTAEKKEGENFLRYSFFTSEYNIIISQIDNTVIYVEVPIEYQEELEKNLNYMFY